MIDRYTKSILTVVAGALVVLVMQNTTFSATAQLAGPQKVQICDLSNCANLEPFIETSMGVTLHRWALDVVPLNKP